jgi:hypothetical protein
MLRSLKRYSEFFIKSSLSKDRRFVMADLQRYLMKRHLQLSDISFLEDSRTEALAKAVDWLIAAQKANSDGGMGSYHLIYKWSSSYPETTGYIIPSLLAFHEKHHHPEALEAALEAAEFLLKIQKPSGGWQGGRVSENRPEIVFNTGQVIRGMIAAYQQSGESKYLDSAVRAGRWLASVVHPEGYWQKQALMEQARVYDTFVDVPLLMLYQISGENLFKETARKNLDWVVDVKMKVNGWFEDCDNTVKRNERPILHTIAYTLDGLIDSSDLLNEQKYLDAAMTGANRLRDIFLMQGYLNGRYDRNWIGSEYFICTGGAQMASVWMKLFQRGGEQSHLLAAGKMINLLVYIQNRKFYEDSNTLGAIPGSFPLWGRYEPFAFPNWATKFFCDALLLEEELRS